MHDIPTTLLTNSALPANSTIRYLFTFSAKIIVIILLINSRKYITQLKEYKNPAFKSATTSVSNKNTL